MSGDLLADNEQDQMRTSSSTVEQQNINNTQAAADKVKPKNNKEAGLLSTYLLRNIISDKMLLFKGNGKHSSCPYHVMKS